MTSITFSLHDGTPPGEVGASLKQICGLTELFNVRAVFPDSVAKSENLVYLADVAEGASALDAVKAIKQAPYVKQAYVTPRRDLLRG